MRILPPDALATPVRVSRVICPFFKVPRTTHVFQYFSDLHRNGHRRNFAMPPHTTRPKQKKKYRKKKKTTTTTTNAACLGTTNDTQTNKSPETNRATRKEKKKIERKDKERKESEEKKHHPRCFCCCFVLFCFCCQQKGDLRGSSRGRCDGCCLLFVAFAAGCTLTHFFCAVCVLFLCVHECV